MLSPSNHAWATKLNANDSTQKEEQLGIVRVEWNTTDVCWKAYKYVLVAADTTVANGTALTYTDVLGHVASSDISDGAINQVCGVGIGAITAEYYGWVQIGGYHSAVLTNADDDISDGDSVILDATTNGTVNSTASGTAAVSKIVGIAVADDINADDTVATMLSIY